MKILRELCSSALFTWFLGFAFGGMLFIFIKYVNNTNQSFLSVTLLIILIFVFLRLTWFIGDNQSGDCNEQHKPPRI